MLTQEESTIAAESVRIALLLWREPTEPIEVTCEHCTDNDSCKCAFDLYNTDGDCLAIK